MKKNTKKKQKIYIIGPVGSGKTTMARNLSKRWKIKHYELDKIIWNDEKGIKREEKERDQCFQKILKKEKWMIEDVGRSCFQEGIQMADIVYYIDLPKRVIYKRIIKRWWRQRLGKEPYNYKPTLKGLKDMLKWARQDKKKEKIKYIQSHAKNYKIIKEGEKL